jgi:hypothetical protein
MMVALFPGSMDDYFRAIEQDHAERDAQRSTEAWLAESDTPTLIDALATLKTQGDVGDRRSALVRTELNNRACAGDLLAAPYKIAEVE